MPKKTKKEKLMALYHRKIRLLENKQAGPTPIPEEKSTIVTTAPVKKEAKILSVEPLSHEDNKLNQYFFSDLRKSLLLIFAIIGLELSLYFVKLIK